MVSLESTLYDVGDNIINFGDGVEELIFIVSGRCEINGVHTIKKNFHRKLFKLSKT